MSEGDQLFKANLQSFVCVAKLAFSSSAENTSYHADQFAKIDQAVFERMQGKNILFKKQFTFNPECDFSYSTVKQLKQIHESKGYSTMIKNCDAYGRRRIL